MENQQNTYLSYLIGVVDLRPVRNRNGDLDKENARCRKNLHFYCNRPR